MDLNIATTQEAAVLKRSLYARLGVVLAARDAARRLSDHLAHKAADMEAHTLYILIENVIGIEQRLMDAEAPLDMAAVVDLQRPG